MGFDPLKLPLSFTSKVADQATRRLLGGERTPEAREKREMDRYHRELQSQIVGLIDRLGFKKDAAPIKGKSHREPGRPDILVIGPNGHVLWLEIKLGDDKLSADQEKYIDGLSRLGHEVHIVSSYQQAHRILYNWWAKIDPPFRKNGLA